VACRPDRLIPVPGTLLILHDSPDFGGHERMLLALLPGLVAVRRFDRIAFAVPAGNARLIAALDPFAPDVVVRPWLGLKARGEPYLRFFRFRYRHHVKRLLTAEGPSSILLVQGRIENLASAVAVLPRNVPVVSYLPMAHTMAAMGRSGLIGDRVRRSLYRRPDAYIVPCAAVADQLRGHGVTVPVEVAYNSVAPPPATPQAEARRQLGFAQAGRLALFLGRLDPAQKGLDRLLDAVAREGFERLGDWSFVLVGDGPGRRMAEEAAARLPPGRVQIVPWTDRPDLYLSAADVLLMPSRWEGLPLAMLEALALGLPVLASPLDAFREFLPPDWLVDFERDDLATALGRAMNPEMREGLVTAARERTVPATLERAQAAFVRAFGAA